MADCADLFLEFNKEISLRPSEKKFLRKARTAITKKIINKFSSKPNIPPVSFKVQGSFTMETIIRPLHGEFDIDIGVYFNFPSSDRANWPTPQTVSGWICDALKNHTSTTSVNRTSCVRVTYKPISQGHDFGYHVDLPVYGSYEDFWGDQYTVIGMNDERKWSEKSAPLAFTNWFFQKCSENEKDRKQLVRLVRYLKAWKDFNSGEIKMPSGMILTILAAKNYYVRDRDDVALYEILNDVYFRLWWGFSVTKPVQPKDNLVSSYSDRRREYFMDKLLEFRDDAYLALHLKSKDEAAKIWIKHLGERFPMSS